MWQYVTKYQNQNPAEHRYQTVKRHTNRTMTRIRAPRAAWLLCLVYMCLCLNNCVDPKLGDGIESLIMMACFTHNDISVLLNFYFWQPVYYLLDSTDQSFGVKSKEKKARWAGVNENIGDKMCYKLVNDESGKIGRRFSFVLLLSLALLTFELIQSSCYLMMPFATQNLMIYLIK